MPDTNYWILPEGIDEALPAEAAFLEQLHRELVDMYANWGYQLVMPPLAEYMESLRTGIGTQLDLQTFKITDQQTGKLMGIRADMTPQVARIDAHCLKTDAINRLCYIGVVLRTRSNHMGASRAPIQVGAELYGHKGVESDAETIELMLQTLDHCGVDNLTLDLGHVGIFRNLSRQAGLSAGEEKHFSDMLDRKSIPEINEWIAQANLDNDVAAMLQALPTLNGTTAILEKANDVLQHANDDVKAELTYLKSLCELLAVTHPELNIHLDLSELRGYSYHTGIVYSVYTPSLGREIARGGRYDGIGEKFGNSRPATGFSCDLKALAKLGNKQAEPKPAAILAPADYDEELITLIRKLRDNGQCVIRQLDVNSDQNLQTQAYTQKIIKQDNSWVVVEA